MDTERITTQTDYGRVKNVVVKFYHYKVSDVWRVSIIVE